jgi:CRP-like cAMP-binding protein
LAEGIASPLADLDLFADVPPTEQDALAARLRPFELDAGATVIAQGDEGTTFVLIVAGSATVTRDGVDVAVVGPGSIVGELALLRGEPRAATVTTTTQLRGLEGDADDFAAVCDAPGVRARFGRTAAQRLATNTAPVSTTLGDGTPVQIRPVLPADRDNLDRALDHMSIESQRRRFFSPGRPSPAMVSYLVDVDYLNHFAWVVITPDAAEGPGIASGRSIRLHDRPDTAEIALGVRDSHQGRGVGKLILGALAAAASVGSVTRFQANVLQDNLPMRSLLDRVGVHWRFSEPGVVVTEFDASSLCTLIDDDLAAALRASARATVAAASLALV